MSTPSIQTLITQAQQVLNLKSSNEIRATLAAVLANANVGTPLNPNLTTQQLWDEFYEIVRQPSDDIMSIITDQMMRMVFSPPAPGGAGADKQVIFNDGGVLAGDAGLMYNKATDALTITGAATVGTTLGVTGISTFAAGTALLPALTTTGDTNTGIYYPAADTFAVTTAGVERYRVDSAGMVGIGVTPSAWSGTGSGQGVVQLGNNGCSIFGAGAGYSANNYCYINNNAYFTTTGFKYFRAVGAAQYLLLDNSHQWLVSSNTPVADTAITLNQAMTLESSGNLLVGKTSSSLGVVGVEARQNGEVWSTNAASTDGAGSSYILYSTGATAYRFYVGMGGTVFATNTTISAISDIRLKENVQDLDVGLNAILALKPRKFDWKEGKGKNIKGDRGFIAQEFETVFPNLIDEWKDKAPEGEAPYKSVRQDLIPVLVKAIQELTARVQTLEAR